MIPFATLLSVEELIAKAKEARERAYAPYSNFRVGAALMTKRGNLYLGCNVENGSYGLTLCAERVAIASAVAGGEREFEALAIVTGAADPTPPCGACRQFIYEFSPALTIITANLSGVFRQVKARDLLPEAFELKRP